MTENRAAVLYGPCDVRIEKWPMPEINEHDVLVRVECVGICGSDVKLYSTCKCGTSVLAAPLVMGHEGAGVVAKVGASVTELKAGDRVAIEPTQPCRRCEFCRTGRYNHCPAAEYSCVDADGSLCRYYKHVADFCHKIPDNLTLEEGAALQPLAVALHACNRAGVSLGSNVLVLGAGPIGVLCAMTAKARGASKVIMTEIVESRLATAKSLIADYALLTHPGEPEQHLVDRIVDQLGAQPDVTIDACACPSAQRVAMMVTKTAGVVLIVGIGGESVEVPLTATMLREVDIKGSYRILNNYRHAIDAVSRGAVDLKSLFTHRYPLDKTREALELAKSGAAMKVIIHVQE